MNAKQILILCTTIITVNSYGRAPLASGIQQSSASSSPFHQQSTLAVHQQPSPLSRQQSLPEDEKKWHEAEIISQEPITANELQDTLMAAINEVESSSRPRSNSLENMIKALKPVIVNCNSVANTFNHAHDKFFTSDYNGALSDYSRLLHSGQGTPEQRRLASIGYAESNLGLHNLQEGFEWRERRISADAGYSVDKLWDGKSDLKQKILLIRPEGGFGDIVFFQSRYVPIIQATYPDCKIILEGNFPQQSIYSLLNNVTIVKPGTCQDYDYALYGMSLPRYFSTKGQKPTTPDTIPNQAYLKAKPELVAQWESHLRSNYIDKGILPVGIFWAASANPGGVFRSYERDIDPALLIDTLTECGNVTLFNLQGPGSESVVQQNKTLIDFPDFDKKSGPFQDTAAFMEALKNVNGHIVGIDTGALNFAGAIGVKTVGLLPAQADWRWGTDEQTSTWFPSITIKRQVKQNDWRAPLTEAKAIIQQAANELLQNKE